MTNVIRVCSLADLGTMFNIEVQSQEFPMPLDHLKEVFPQQDHTLYKAVITGRAVGFGYLVREKAKAQYTIWRVSVPPSMRGHKIGTAILDRMMMDAKADDCVSVRMHVPSYKMDDPKDPDYLGDWLWRNQFKAIGCLTDEYWRYGRWYDAYTCERMV